MQQVSEDRKTLTLLRILTTTRKQLVGGQYNKQNLKLIIHIQFIIKVGTSKSYCDFNLFCFLVEKAVNLVPLMIYVFLMNDFLDEIFQITRKWTRADRKAQRTQQIVLHQIFILSPLMHKSLFRFVKFTEYLKSEVTMAGKLSSEQLAVCIQFEDGYSM